MQPSSYDRPLASDRDLAACRAALRDGSKTFLAASLLLPRRVRDGATALYAFCRLADDVVDGQSGGRGLRPARPQAVDAIRDLRARLAAAYNRAPHDAPQDRAFADVVATYAIPRALPEALLEGLEWDATGRLYPDIAALDAYAARVAGSVGAMMARLMGATDADTLARACDLGIAMQFTNIARDVGEDARAGRLYLPVSWMREAGVDPEAFLASPRFTPELGQVVRRLLEAADALYDRARSGVAALPAPCRPGIHAARLLYAEIGREVERQGCDSVASRAVVPASRKALLLARILSTMPRAGAAQQGPTRAEANFLVEALKAAPRPQLPRDIPWWNLPDRWVGVIELFEKLERRERAIGIVAPPAGVRAEARAGG
jgi:phytoene synthase